MKQFSIIVPVFNEPKYITQCLISLTEQTYPSHNFEIIVVNDCSTDQTQKTLEKFIQKNKTKNLKIIKNKTNLGRMKSRAIGASDAKNHNLLFIDARVEIHKTTLEYLNTRKEKVIIAGDKGNDTRKNQYDLFFHQLRKLLFKKTYPQKSAIVKITTKNFGKIPKGTICYFEKQLFHNCMQEIKNTSKHASDDTNLFLQALKHTPYLIRDNNFKVNYHHRNTLKENIIHIFNRGPKFVNHYLHPKRHFFIHLLIIYIFTAFNLILLFTNPQIILYEVSLIFSLIVITAIFISESLKSFAITVYLLPIITISFYLGLLKGLIIRK